MEDGLELIPSHLLLKVLNEFRVLFLGRSPVTVLSLVVGPRYWVLILGGFWLAFSWVVGCVRVS